MTPERWKRTEELYHAASALPPSQQGAFLFEACGQDEALRRELESLLTESASDDGFLEGAAMAVAAPSAGNLEPATMIGRSLGAYRLEALLGVGGMGEVYRARDVKLARDVAIKILPPAFTSDPDRLARFEREARLLAALNHPNICAIYGVEDADDVRFLILELVNGETLAERLVAQTRAMLPIPEAVAIGRQIAEALEVAHDKGIIHRDLKPANVKITPDGVAKVLDFGLAKAVGNERASPDLTHVAEATRDGIRPGAVMGTAAYMSPEQARGLRVDKRTDIWAFGCVFYQMLTGRIAFGGETASDSIAKILERDPDWSALPPSTPVAIRRLLVRCLAKDPKRRLRDIGDATIELDAIDEVVLGGSGDTLSPSARPAALTQWLPWAALIAVALSIAAWQAWRPAAVSDNPLANARFTPFTNWDGTEEAAEISPDGKFVAFLADQDGEFDIWLSQVGTGRFSNLTRDFPPLAPGGSIVRKLGFSGDGAEIWFNPASRKPLLLMPFTGGAPRPFLGEGTNTPAWSPDGRRLVYFQKPLDGADPMYMADHPGANARQIFQPREELHSNNPVWAPDGEWIYFVSGSEPQDETNVNVWRIRSLGGTPEQLTNQHAAVNFLAPIDARTLLFTARDDDGSGPWLWSLDVERKHRQRVSPGVDQYTSVSASRDGRRIVATVANPSASLWRVPVSDRLASDDDVEPYALPAPTGRALAPRFGATAFFYLSGRGSGDGLWKVQDGQAFQVWRDVDGALFEPPAVSPDGRRLAVVVRQNGRRQVSVMAEDGTNARTLATSIDIQGAAGQTAVDWSPDGKWIVAGGHDTRGPALFKIAVEGQAVERLLDGKWLNPVWSPVGNLIVYAGRSVVGQVILRAMQPNGTPVDLPEIWVRPAGYRFTPDGKNLVYVPAIHALDLWMLDLSTMKSRPLTRLGNRGTIRTFDITPDGRQIVFDRLRQNSNIVLIDLPQH